ncbi:hypothetical protein QPK87_22340 [Kamptonema cortianum]|uniref:PEP-CTERM sorting domain-containing protein n=1 Tax=Geitlerinema calcuttense NRMC-F 0142 TaxID=2922238 RepID=A0ABT7LXT7_9CYAN|nr:hypothetical protein [Geitlerinema calcuttense]MDK3159290.1 hypothetical protein [Kamptonema cortianum]MDL5056826.1 hypothetical protein [Geitlerinema calcuttense NRMC-F 0142]
MKLVKNSLKFCVLTLSLSLASLVFQGVAKAASPYRLGYTFLNPNPAANDFFGISVAGVGNNVLIGAFQDDTNALDAGAAYLFDGNPTSPTFGQLLMTFQSPNPAVSGNFGGSVASVGNNILIGESFRHATLAQGQPGRAYLFDGTPQSSTFGDLLMTFQAPIPRPFDFTGFSVAGMGNNVLIGAFGNNIGAPLAGAAYLFDGDRASPTFGELLTTFNNPNPGAGDRFGVAVASVGKNVLIGSFRDDVGGVDAGAAYLFDGDRTSPTFGQLLLSLSNPHPSPTDAWGQNDEFGHSVASVGNNCLVGAFREDIGALNVGRAYLYDCNPSSPTFGSLLTQFQNFYPYDYGWGDLGENFGFSLASIGHYALIGAWRELAGAALAGAVYVYDANPTSPQFGQLVGAFFNPNPTAFGSFGTSIAVMGQNIVIGAIGEQGGSGAAFLFAPTANFTSLRLASQPPSSVPEPAPALATLLLGSAVLGNKARQRRNQTPEKGSTSDQGHSQARV